ncbi:hypothetical protein ACB092_02G001500 [Castanea dentata]
MTKKRWLSAFVSIYYSRASLPKKNNAKIPPCPSFVSLDLNPDNRWKTDQSSLNKIDQTSLTELVKEKNIEKLQIIGGVDGVTSILETNVECGIHGNVEDIAHRHEAFGSNTYKRLPTKSFFHFVVEAFKDLTILILLGYAVLSLVFGIKDNGIKEGWYDGGSIFVAIFLVIVVSTINIICLKIGDQVPVDGLFLDGHSLQVDKSSMTGESDHVEVNCIHPFLFSSTKVVDGYARILVASVGMITIWGEMMSSISRDTNEQTPLQFWLNRLTSSIGKVGLVVAFLVLIVLLVRYFTENTEDENGNKEFNGSSTKVNDILNAMVGIVAAAVTIIVVAIPEGLPLAVTLTLAYSMKRIMVDQAMVQKLSASKTMGSATTICTDKTGTLTLNKMKVTKFWLGKESFPASGSEIEFSGSPTEQVIISWVVLELSMEMERLMQSCKILYVEALNSQKKRSEVLMRRNANNTIHVHWKGVVEMILKMCSSYYNASGILKDLDDGMAANSLRCIAFAHKQIEEEDLTLLGVVGIKDPYHPGVKKAVEDCQNASVNIKMIIGDNVFTAKAIATECGMLEGVKFKNYTPEERMERVDKICVMARSSPFNKLLMVECLKQKGHVVVITGDGINDAPELKEADVGLSMGIQGTEVAKKSSNIVILDDNFASISTKFIQFQLSVNVAALVINFVAAVSAGKVSLTAIQLLWVNLIMDTLGALALATEKPTEELMTKPLITNIIVTEKVNDTLIFNTFVPCQVFNEFNAIKFEKKNVFKGIHRNKLFLGIIAITIVLQVVMVEFLK